MSQRKGRSRIDIIVSWRMLQRGGCSHILDDLVLEFLDITLEEGIGMLL